MSLTVLSTKILTLAQKELVLNAGLGLVAYDALSIVYLDFDLDNGFDHYIFTSQNAVGAFLQKHPDKLAEKTVFCVGEKTKKKLEENGANVLEFAQNSSELAQIIEKDHKNHSFLFFLGNLRRDEIPDVLKQHNVRFKEMVVYKTSLNQKAFDSTFVGVLFFSPSGVESFTMNNTLNNTPAFCIGETTATEAKKHTDKIIIANKPTIENVLVQAVKYFKTND